MGNGDHLCFSLVAMVAPTCFRTASLDDTPGEQMCSNEFILNSDVRDFFFIIPLSFCSVCIHQKSFTTQEQAIYLRDNTDKYLLLWKLKLLFWRGHLHPFSVTRSSSSSYVFTFSLFLHFRNV